VIMGLWVGDGEPDRNEIEERRVGYLSAEPAEIISGVEDEFEPARARLGCAQERLVGAAVRIGQDIGDELALALVRQLVELDPHARRRPATRHVEDMGRNARQILLPWR